MRFNLKLPLLLAVLAVGLIGVSAASASAHSFLAATYPAEVKAKQSNDQGFEIAGATSVCTKAKFTGTLSAASETILVHPEYSGCEVELGGTHLATVLTTGCNYKFHAAGNLEAAGSVDVECESSKEIIVHVEGLSCEIKIPAQTGLKTITYMNEPSGKISVEANVSGITWSSNCSALSEKSGKAGKYREGGFNASKEPVLETGPAIALTEGLNSSKEADALMVE